MTTWAGGQQIPPLSPLPRVSLQKGQATLAIVLAAPDQTIAGSVVDETGAPVPDASVRVTGDSFGFGKALDVAVSDANGHFEIRHLASGSFGVLAIARDGASKTVDATAGSHDVRITLDRAGAIEGTFVGFKSQPSIVGSLRTGGMESIDFEIDGSHFRAHGLSSGDYMITAVTNGHDADTQRVTVAAGKTASVVLTSRGTATLTGHVIDWITKQPFTSARCSPPMPRSGALAGTFYGMHETEQAVDPSGAFHFDNVTAGDVLIGCSTNGTVGLRLATIVPDSTAQLDVYLVTPKSGGGDIGNFGWRPAFQSVQPNAAKAGMQVGDIVAAIDGQSTELLDGLTIHNAISTHVVGSSISLTVRRAATTLTLEIML